MGMAVSWYAESPARRSRQIAADVLAVAGLLGCLWVGTGVHDLTAELAGPGRALESAGSSLSDRMDDAADVAGDTPLAGDELAAPFEGAGDASRAIEDAGAQQQQAVATLATGLGWATGGIPALFLVLLWLPRRLRFARQAGQAARLRAANAGLDLLALRALTLQPLTDLGARGPALVQGWRDRDADAVEALAALELRRLGLRTRSTPT
jgi:hypothetical protein